jgi:hypothetical protein
LPYIPIFLYRFYFAAATDVMSYCSARSAALLPVFISGLCFCLVPLCLSVFLRLFGPRRRHNDLLFPGFKLFCM